ncbi:MAG: IS21 family transposase [Deltaproteobacteria bacterium]|nr:IS21 family transposase [Deltaproteobacteria bacterium]
MIDYELYCKIRHLKEQEGLNAHQIAGELAMDPRTVGKWLTRERFCPRKASPRSSKIDPFKNEIARMLQTHAFTAAQILVRIRGQGFAGGYSIVKDYVRSIRPPKSPAYLTLAFAPGECAQVDWGCYGSVAVGNTRRRLSFFVMVLCYSRMLYCEFTVSQSMEHFLACHKNAFDFFGCAPQKIMVDNLKSAVLRRIVGRAPVFNPRYLDFANHYGFTIAACNVGRGNEKGRVENAVGYVKKNFLAGLDIPDFAAIAPAARNWLETVANVRIHGETRKKPVELFEAERPCLLPLPINDFDIATVCPQRASSQFRITLDTNRYSVPAEYAGRALTVKTDPERICVYAGDDLIARHIRSYERYQDFEDPDHPKALLSQRKKARDQKIFMRFISLSPKADLYYRKLHERRLNPQEHVRKIVALSEIYSHEPVARAIEDAFVFEAFSCEYIANLLQQRARFHKEPSALHLTRREDLLDITLEHPDLSIYYERNTDD